MNEITERAIHKVRQERERQIGKWSREHDKYHERFEWVGLIALYAAQGKLVEAGALCIAAIEAEEPTHEPS